MVETRKNTGKKKKTRAGSRGKKRVVAAPLSKLAGSKTPEGKQKKNISTGGFSPRLAKRPKYPSFANVLWHTILSYIRIPLLCTLLTLGVESLYKTFVIKYALNKFSERTVFTLGTLLTHTLLYVSINGFFLLCQHKGWFEEYRFERKPYQVPKWELKKKTLLEAFVGQVISGPFVLYYMYTFNIYNSIYNSILYSNI